MSGFEDLIRDTIAKQGEPTHAVRTRVYASARSALERMIAARSGDGGEDAQAAQQRDALETAIGRIEAEHAAPAKPLPDPVARPAGRTSHYAPDPTPPDPTPPVVARDVPAPSIDRPTPVAERVAPAPQPAPARSPPPVRSAPQPASMPESMPAQPIVPEPVEPRLADPGPLAPVNYAPGPAPGRKPSRTDPSFADPSAAPSFGEPVVTPAAARDVRAEERARWEADQLLSGRPRSKPWVLLLLWTIVLAGLGTAIWWGWTFGRSTIESIAIPPAASEIVAPPPRVGEADAGWVTVFDPATDIAAVVADGGTSDLIDGARGRVLRIAADGADAGITIQVPPGVMQSVRGGRATFEVTVRAADGTHSFAVQCDFGAADCGRKRFEAGVEPAPYLFDADMTQAAGNGTILFVPDVEGQGRAIEVERIRVRVG